MVLLLQVALCLLRLAHTPGETLILEHHEEFEVLRR